LLPGGAPERMMFVRPCEPRDGVWRLVAVTFTASPNPSPGGGQGSRRASAQWEGQDGAAGSRLAPLWDWPDRAAAETPRPGGGSRPQLSLHEGGQGTAVNSV